MKTMIMMLVGVAMQIQSANADPVALQQRMESFTIVLNGSAASVTPLFGPVRETEWAPTWVPRFIHPAEGAQREGVVFTTTTGDGKERFWLLTAYDAKEGRVEYVFIA